MNPHLTGGAPEALRGEELSQDHTIGPVAEAGLWPTLFLLLHVAALQLSPQAGWAKGSPGSENYFLGSSQFHDQQYPSPSPETAVESTCIEFFPFSVPLGARRTPLLETRAL